MNAFSKKISFHRQSHLCDSVNNKGLYDARSDYYRKIIERYSQAVSNGETKTIPQLKELVNPFDKTVLETKQKIFESDFKVTIGTPPNGERPPAVWQNLAFAWGCCLRSLSE